MTESRCPACTCIGFHTSDCTRDEMTLRDRIAAVQQAHIFRITECSCGYMFPWEKSTEWRERAEREWARHVADVILAIPGIAVVELPEPARVGRFRCWPALVGGEPESIYRAGDEVVVSGGLRLYADEARDLAAALLAAADYAERDQ